MPTTTAHTKLTLAWRDNMDYDIVYLDVDKLHDGRILAVARKDTVRPEIGIDLTAALMHLEDEQRADLLGGDAAVMIVQHRNFDIGPVLFPNTHKPFMQFAVTIRVLCASGEIRETAWDCDKFEWVAPWFNFDTGVVNP